MLVIPLFISLLANNFLIAQGNGISCGEGYIPNEGNKNCIKIVYTSATWDEAKTNCQADKGNLLIIDNEEENTFVTNKLTNGKYVWVGARNKKCGGLEFINADDTKTTYTKWNQRQPDNWRGQEMCVMIFGKKAVGTFQGRWNDYGCQKKLPYVCERAVVKTLKTCPDGWKLYEKDNMCTKIVEEQKSFADARALCQAEQRGDLVKIEDKDKDDFLKAQLKDTQYWIGVENVNKKGGIDMRFLDGNQLGSYHPWGSTQPNNRHGTELCVLTIGTSYQNKFLGKWADFKCSIPKSFICEMPARG